MNTKYFPAGFDARRHLQILKATLITMNTGVLLIYACLLLIFSEMPFVALDQLTVIVNSMAWATGIGVGICSLLFAADGIAYLIRNRKQVKFKTGRSAPEANADYSSASALVIDMNFSAGDDFSAGSNLN